jgi:hypothetical protein
VSFVPSGSGWDLLPDVVPVIAAMSGIVLPYQCVALAASGFRASGRWPVRRQTKFCVMPGSLSRVAL